MRKIFGEWIVKKAEEDDKIVLIVGDIGYGIFDEFKKKFPERYFNLGLCEQSIVSIAAGLALSGMKPYVYTITPFLIERAFEQIKIDIDAMNTNVKLIGYADYPNQGITHQEILTPEILDTVLKNTICFQHHNKEQLIKSLEYSYEKGVPTYISLKKEK